MPQLHAGSLELYAVRHGVHRQFAADRRSPTARLDRRCGTRAPATHTVTREPCLGGVADLSLRSGHRHVGDRQRQQRQQHFGQPGQRSAADRGCSDRQHAGSGTSGSDHEQQHDRLGSTSTTGTGSTGTGSTGTGTTGTTSTGSTGTSSTSTGGTGTAGHAERSGGRCAGVRNAGAAARRRRSPACPVTDAWAAANWRQHGAECVGPERHADDRRPDVRSGWRPSALRHVLRHAGADQRRPCDAVLYRRRECRLGHDYRRCVEPGRRGGDGDRSGDRHRQRRDDG